jgi:alcohol dehydrogenase (cytochrome c)
MRIIALLFLLVQTAFAQVSYERIRRADAEPGNWLTYSGNYQSYHSSLLTQINTGNVGRLRPL